MSVFASVRGGANRLNLPRARRVVVVLVDGLGAENLSARAAHARTLTALPQRAVVGSFPTTTASALASLMTGSSPGETGMVGYAVRNPKTGSVVNQLSGLDTLDVSTWQPIPTVWERNQDVASAIVSSPRYLNSGLTRAILRGGDYRAARSNDERVSIVADFFRDNRDGVVYVYVPELDMTAHASGVNSDKWIRRLEELDGLIADILRILTPGDGLVVSADHGVVDVPARDHILLEPDSDLVDGVLIGGEPRFLHVYCDDDPIDVANRWMVVEGHRAHIVHRRDAIAAGWFGTVRPEMAARIGDILVTPRGNSVYYDLRTAAPGSLAMVGQHGGLSPTELRVPLVRGGVFA